MSVFKRDRFGRTIPRKIESKTPGTWYYAFMIHGTRYRDSVPEARTRSQAERAEVAAKEDVYQDRYGLRKSPIFAEFVERVYLPWAQANKRGYQRNDAVYAKCLMAFFGQYRLAEITPLLIEKYKKERRESRTIHGTTRKPATVNRELACLSKIFSTAFNNGEVQSNPCGKVRRLRENNKRSRYLLEEEEERLMIALADAPEYLASLVVLALQTGMRKGEMLKLEWRDVDFNRCTIKIRDAKNPTGESDREIPMSNKARDVLASIRTIDTYVFHITDFKKSWASALRRASITNFRFHDLRHTAATRWGAAGALPHEISDLLGNSILVGKRYTHAIAVRLRRVVEDACPIPANILKTDDSSLRFRAP
jgi:integrase